MTHMSRIQMPPDIQQRLDMITIVDMKIRDAGRRHDEASHERRDHWLLVIERLNEWRDRLLPPPENMDAA